MLLKIKSAPSSEQQWRPAGRMKRAFGVLLKRRKQMNADLTQLLFLERLTPSHLAGVAMESKQRATQLQLCEVNIH